MQDRERLLARLRQVQEADAATAQSKEDAKVARAAKPKVPNPCQCGCGGQTMARFVPGHDAKLKSRLLKQAHGEDQDAALEALQKLDEMGWAHFFVARTKPEAKKKTIAA